MSLWYSGFQFDWLCCISKIWNNLANSIIDRTPVLHGKGIGQFVHPCSVVFDWSFISAFMRGEVVCLLIGGTDGVVLVHVIS